MSTFAVLATICLVHLTNPVTSTCDCHQAISRSGFAYYELTYGYQFDVSNCTGDSACYAALLYATIITPTVSFGYLALFLKIEPHAYNKFRELFGLPPSDRSRWESKDTIGKIGAGAGAASDASSSAAGSSVKALSIDQPRTPTGTGTARSLASSQVESEDTTTSQAQVARESSLYVAQMHQSSYGWATSSIWRADAEEADDRDEAELLESINSESHLGPLSFSQHNSFSPATRTSQIHYDAEAARNPLGVSWASLTDRTGKSTSLNMTLQSSTTSPIAIVSGVMRADDDDSHTNSSL